ncbi:MAG: bifunctional DNA-formamidopyrimidine glycosylase/DNA-(apurinic or apyrimidinic site) lyase [Gemmataceae bacterium]|nr:bifunctional DNA-formamidopyrimidine glycosylase/DNA-(apurinic or apyrimidinic site) lyase [Gemmataceae bacterium]MDW8266758.1 bifunctional DNA-formamidopyrimidine glycosylase/DNA-(apurinic or apyrimidinic site) lyase [Gemmataceae bacterium]
MPELPEVETVVRDLRPRLVGRRMGSVICGPKPLRRRWQRAWGRQLPGRRVVSAARRGKWILLGLDDGAVLAFHLGMTGRLQVQPRSTPLPRHTHLRIGLDNDHELRFRDIRRFGAAVRFAHADELEAFFRTARLGPEPFDLTAADWRQRLARTRRCVKAVLLDQRMVAGVGNIYADEALFEARLHPACRARDVSAAAAERLRRAVVTVLRRAIDRRGSSIRDYVGGLGQPGAYQDEFRVYGRVGQPCLRCRAPIARIRLAGRSTHFCPRCQPAGHPGEVPTHHRPMARRRGVKSATVG